MNILFLSNRSRRPWSGPYYSIPAQIRAQSKIDQVLWVNENNESCEEWEQSGLPFVNLNNLSADSLKVLPRPFNHPDIVIVEEVYTSGISHIIREVQKAKIPYIIIPRSHLTSQGQKRKPLKKWLANLIYYKRLVYNAAAIQYLTVQEKQDSGEKWNKNCFVLPNGINMPSSFEKSFSQNSIKGVYVGRIEKYQKGLDLLFEACYLIRKELALAKFTLQFYGYDQSNSRAILSSMVQRYGLGEIISFTNPVFGEEKAKVLQQADVFIMTSRFEGHPMGLIEALAYGLPCVVTTGTNMRPEIEEYNAGWTADNTVGSIVCALKKMLQEREHFAQKSNQARKLAERYNWDKIAQQSHEIYKEILGRKL